MDELQQNIVIPATGQLRLLPPMADRGQRAQANRFLLPVGAVLTAVLCIVAIFCSRFTLCLQVTVDGEPVGRLADEGQLEEIVGMVEHNVSDLLGYDYGLDSRVSYRLGLVSTAQVQELDTHVVEKGIYDSIGEIDMCYAISVDGSQVGYVSDLAEIRNALDGYLSKSSTTDTVSATLLSEVDFDYTYVDVEDALEPEAIDELVESLSVEVVDEILYTESIPHAVDVIYDEDRYTEDREVLREGRDGVAEITAQITYIDGQTQETEILSSTTLLEPVSEIVIEGMLERPLTASTGSYIWPSDGTISSNFGPRSVAIGSSNHQGIDIASPADSAVYAADGGEVIFAGWSGGYGNLVQIQHDNGEITYYAHNNSIDVETGDLVYQGQVIARVGMTGTASGNHVHFEIRVDGMAVDPLIYLP